MISDLVLVTGGTGFVGIHCIVALLRSGYRVRTTVRSLDRSGEIRTMLIRAGLPDAALEIVAAELTQDDGWAAAVENCRHVLHVASPFQVGKVRHEDDLVIPAREGTLRVLRAARDAGIECRPD
jgi:dihydroflavonol-4-reductase